MKSLLSLSILSLALASCTTTNSNAIMGGHPPETTPASWQLVGPVEGKGSAFTLSPGLPFIHTMTTQEKAREDAVGRAIFENNAIDMLVAPKTRTTYTSFLIFDMATCEVKGQGVKLR